MYKLYVLFTVVLTTPTPTNKFSPAKEKCVQFGLKIKNIKIIYPRKNECICSDRFKIFTALLH